MWLALLMVTGSASVGQFRSGVSLVEVFAAVTDDQGRPVADLTAGDFAVEEDGVGQRIETFIAGELPLAVAIALDRSFSMTPERLAGSARAVRVFLDALGPADQVMLVAIGSKYVPSLRPPNEIKLVGCGSATTSRSSAASPFTISGIRGTVLPP